MPERQSTAAVPVGEQPLAFACKGQTLVGILHPAPTPSERGVLVVVGGPQYRVGSHRQFVLLARHLAAEGIPVLRFDYRGMGDSEGEPLDFEGIEEDIRSAVDALQANVPGLREVVIWGLCDAASAGAFYAPHDPRIAGLVLLNPWVRSEEGIARAYLRHYYVRRLFSRELWSKLRRGQFRPGDSWRSLVRMLRNATRSGPTTASTEETGAAGPPQPAAPLPERMADGLSRFRGPVLIILSGNDLTAAEFRDVSSASRRWRRLLRAPRVTRRELPEADHTFSRGAWRDRTAAWTVEWLRSW